MTTAKPFTVGETVWINTHRGAAREGVVTKVGRTRVTVERVGDDKMRWDVATQYRMDTRREIGDFPTTWIENTEQRDDRIARESLTETLAHHGVRVTETVGWKESKLSTRALAEIARVVAEDRRMS